MSHVRRFFRRLTTLLRSTKAERELSREIDAHLQLLEDRHVAHGMSREEARRAARRAFGGVEQAKELQREARSFRWLAGWPMDMKLGVRMLFKYPGLTVIAVIALGVALAAGATYLEFVNGMVRPALPIPDGERLIGIYSRDIERQQPERRILADFRAWRAGLTLVEHVGASQDIHGDVITGDGQAQRVDGVRISASAFRLVPASPLLGRPLVASDEDASAPPVAVIGEALWASRFNRDPAAVGRALTIGKERYTIVGVMPASFGFPVNQVLWIPLRDTGTVLARGEGPAISVFGRLVEGASFGAAQAEVEALARAGSPAAGGQAAEDEARRFRPIVAPYVPSLIASLDAGQQMRALYAVNLAFVGLLCVCAANVATLVFGRTVTREAEITVRAALGASRGRIVSQLVAEAIVLASAAAVVGLGAAKLALAWVRPAWRQGNGSELPFWWSETLDWETLVYTAILVVLAALIVGGVPGLKATGPRMQARLKHAGAGSSMRFGRLWTGVIVSQVALTVVFLLSVIAMGISLRTIIGQFEDVAFERGHYMTAWVETDADAPAYRRREALLAFLRASAPVENATYTTRLPGVDQEQTYFDVDGDIHPVSVAHVGPDYFETFERPFIAGRGFASSELESGAGVAIVDESFARFVLGGRSAVGRQVRVRDMNTGELGPWIEIVGVTADMSTSASKTLRDARLYRPIGAAPASPVNLVVHARAGYRADGLGPVAAALRGAAASAPPGIHMSEMRTLAADGGGDVIEYVFTALGIVGAVALLLATAGIYALVSFTLARRTREIGIRTALGASPGRIVTGILSRAMWQIGLGVLLGALPGFLIVGSVAKEAGHNGYAYGLMGAAAIAGFVLIVAAISCSVPLRRALRIDPTEALRVS